MSNKKLINDLRCLRMHLLPILNDENKALLERVEESLKNPGPVSTVPALSSKSKLRNRTTKKQIYEKYLNQ